MAAIEQPLLRVVDLNFGATGQVELHDGAVTTIKLLRIHESRRQVMGDIQQIDVEVQVNDEQGSLVNGLYWLPIQLEGVQTDCPTTSHYDRDSHLDHAGLEKLARI